MPRHIALAAAGLYLINNPPPEATGRGSVANRAATLAGFSTAQLVEYLFTGLAPTAFEDNIGVADMTEFGTVITNGAPMSYVSTNSIDLEPAVGEYVSLTSNFWGATAHAFEMWYQLEELPDRHAVAALGASLRLIANSNNDSAMIGAVVDSQFIVSPFPRARNVFNGVSEWQSFYDFYIQDQIFQLVEAHEVGTRANYIVVLNGVPIAVGTNSGQLPQWDAAGPAFNGNGSTAVAEKIGGQFGYFTVFDDGQTLSLQDIRELFETSSFDNANMLDLPIWSMFDSENVTIDDPLYILKQANLADVLDTTGMRSCAIPRSVFRLKIYFELEIIDQGDSVTAVRPGLRRMITAADVGDQTTVGEDGNEHHFYIDGTDLRVDRATLVHAGATDQSTGRVYGFAIDWETGDFWVSEDGVFLQGNPSTSTNPSGTLDKNTAWAAHVWNNGADGNAQVKLRTRFYEMIHPLPTNYDSWETKTFTVEAEPFGPNRRQAQLDRIYNQVEHEWLFEGDAADYLVDTARVTYERHRDMIIGVDAVDLEAGPKISQASVGSVRWLQVANAQGEVQQDIWDNCHAFEFWFRQPDLGHGVVVSVVNSQSNNWMNIGRQGTDLFPSARNNFNTGLIWLNDEVDVYGDDKPHQLMEIHEGADNVNYFVTLDGMPIADGANKGYMVITGGPEFNGHNNGADSQRSGAHFGSFTTYRGGDVLTLLDVRKLYEASVIIPQEEVNAGVQSGDITDGQLSASTEFNVPPLLEARFARLSDGSVAAEHWSPTTSTTAEWWKIDFGSVVTVKGIKTQGEVSDTNWVQTYKLEYNNDDSGTWIPYNGDETLTGNVEGNDVVTNMLFPFQCRYLRVRPQTWNTFIALRTEFILEQDADSVEHAAGVETGLINNDEMTASSITSGRESYDGRLNGLGHSPGSALTTEWLKIDLGRVVDVTEHKIQGAFVQWYQTYFLEYNNDDSATWIPYNNSEVLNANVDATAVVTNVLIPFRARYIRIRPLTWSGWPTIRTEFTIKNDIVTDMLSSPQWCSRDGVNIAAIGGTGNKDLTLGDVNNDTGIRSYAIPRRGKVYFEFEIIAEGDSPAGTLPGIRIFAESGNVGHLSELVTDAFWVQSTSVYQGDQTAIAGQTAGLGNSATGRIFQVAIDWTTGDWWMGTDDTAWAGIGGVGDPSTGANPFAALDLTRNWGAYARTNGTLGNGQIRLVTATTDLNFTPPIGFVAWEDAL